MNTNDLIDIIKMEIDLLEYVSRDTQLSRSGRNYKGRCPQSNHSDTNPSFVVGLNRKGELVASCFGCGALNMDVINYVQWRDGVNFSTAIEILCDEFDIHVECRQDKDVHLLLTDIMSLAQDQLYSSDEAKKYLMETRGLSEDVVEQAQLGFVANGYRLIQELKAKGYTWSDLRAIGFITDKFRCKFSGRILIPISMHGRIEALAGRQVNTDDKFVRYLYTQTSVPPVYTLSEVDVRKPLLLVEGLMDLMSARTLGFKQVAALVSAAVASRTEIDQLVQQCQSVLYLGHEDKAGQKALGTLQNRFPGKIVPVHLPVGFEDLNDALVKGYDREWLRDLFRETAREHRTLNLSAS